MENQKQVYKKGLSRKILLNVVITVGAMLSVTTVSFVLVSIFNMNREQQKQVAKIAATFSASSIDALLVRDYPAIKTSVDNILVNNTNMLWIRVRHPNGILVAEADRKEAETASIIFKDKITYEDNLLAFIELGFSTTAKKKEIAVNSAFILGMGLLTVFVLSVKLFISMKKMVITPINLLQDFICQVGTGQLDKQITVSSEDEFGRLANAFNKMTLDLRRTTVSINILNKEVDERKKAEEKLTQLLSLHTATLESTADGILVVDLHGKVASYNRKFLQLWQIPDSLTDAKDDDKLLAFVLDQLVDSEQFIAGVRRLYSHPEKQSIDTLEFKNGRVFERASQPHKIGSKIVGRVWCFRDISTQKQTEKTMKRLNHDLENTVAELENANRELKNFVYIASHDLREPLRKISAFGTMLEKSLKDKIAGDDAENLHYMIDGAGRMTKMIEGLLVYSRVSTQTQPFQTVDLNEIVNQLRQIELSMALQEKQVVLDIPQPLPCIEADTIQIRQLMQNLIANGIKYQKKDNLPRITVIGKSASDGMVRIEITDNGIGIAPEYQGAIFTMFKRLHNRSEYEGTGIGLAVCKKIVERHGGQIGIESQAGQGSTFWFTMPMAEKLVCAGV